MKINLKKLPLDIGNRLGRFGLKKSDGHKMS